MDDINHQKEFLEHCKSGNIQILRDYYNNYLMKYFRIAKTMTNIFDLFVKLVF